MDNDARGIYHLPESGLHKGCRPHPRIPHDLFDGRDGCYPPFLDAKAQGIEYAEWEENFADNDRALAEGGKEGKIKLVLDVSAIKQA